MAEWTIKSLIAWTEAYFGDRKIDSPRLAAEILLSKTLKMRRLDLYLQHDRPLEKQELARFKAFIKRRVSREPVAYITGQKGFFNDIFSVAKGVLIPRPDTEILVETALEILQARKEGAEKARVIDLGVGSGAIVVSLANACPGHVYFGSDISSAALAAAAANAKDLCQTPICFFQGAWLGAISFHARFDLILSNPPYIPRADIAALEPEIKNFEPLLALDGGEDGLDAIRIILGQAGERLVPGGRLILEMGYDQKEGVATLARDFSWISKVGFVKDLAGHDRLAVFKK